VLVAGRVDPGRYDDAVTDPSAAAPGSAPPKTPGERRLARPPSDRYRSIEPVPADPERTVSAARGAMLAVGAAIAGAVAITILGGMLAVSAGLLVVAGATGWAVALGLRVGGGASLPASRRARLALALALLAVVLGQVGLWLYARTEGGVLGPLDYLGETFGPLVPLELAAAGLASWVAAR
jgi:hypothetical protein